MTQDEENEEAVEVLLAKADRLTEWEVCFLQDLEDQLPRISHKQQKVLDGIWRRVMG